ncbi:MAG TPA: universal stress protein [Chloroflexota bacterium]|nr:universal stress protein [Chloroflexota bacterium]
MIRSILLPLDGSQFAFGALPYATTIARGAGARLELVTVTADVAAQETDGDEKRFAPDDSTYDMQEWSPEAVAARLRSEGLSVGTHVYVGDPAGEIVMAADALGADLVVMATHGRTGLGRWLFGSVADGVLRQAGTPVLLVPPYTPPWTAAELARGPRRVLVPLDGTDLSEAALEPAAALAAAGGAEVRLLRVAAPTPPSAVVAAGGGEATASAAVVPMPSAEADPAVEAVEEYLEDAAARIRGRVRAVDVDAELGEPEAAIVAAARAWGAHAIAMATHTHRDPVAGTLGRRATRVLRSLEIPALLVRPTALHV